MCTRLIALKTGVSIPLEDISACHIIRNRSSDPSYIIRIHNQKPGSAWEILAAGLLTGRNLETKANFSNHNLFLNFQVTRKKGELVKEVKKAKATKSVHKYGTDQNGRLTVRIKNDSPWVEVTSLEELQGFVNSPPTERQERRRQPWQGSGRPQHRQH